MLSIRISVENASDRIRPKSKGDREPSKFKKALRVGADTQHLLFVIRLRDEAGKAMEIAHGEHPQLDVRYLKSLFVARPCIPIFG